MKRELDRKLHDQATEFLNTLKATLENKSGSEMIEKINANTNSLVTDVYQLLNKRLLNLEDRSQGSYSQSPETPANPKDIDEHIAVMPDTACTAEQGGEKYDDSVTNEIGDEDSYFGKLTQSCEVPGCAQAFHCYLEEHASDNEVKEVLEPRSLSAV